MLRKIEHLSATEQDLILSAPLLVTALVSGADGDFSSEEIKKAVKVIHIKTYSEKSDVRGVYKEIDMLSEDRIMSLIDALPEETFSRTEFLTDKLKGLNDIFPKLDAHFAKDLLKSLKELAYYVSNANESGISFSNEMEEKIAELKFLKL